MTAVFKKRLRTPLGAVYARLNVYALLVLSSLSAGAILSGMS